MEKYPNYYALSAVKLGDITASGWVRDQLIRNRDGMGGHLSELEPQMIDYPYRGISSDGVWNKAINAGWGAEISGNYWKGLIMLAFTLDDSGLKKKAEDWVNDVLKTQRPDGYMGAYRDGDNFFDDYNGWGTNCGMSALLLYFEATGRKDVFDAVYRCMLWFCENWTGDKKGKYCGKSIIECMIWCYLYTKDERLLNFSEEYIDFIEKNDIFGITLNQKPGDRIVYNSFHGAGYANLIKHNAIVYAANGNRKYLADSLNLAGKAVRKIMQRTGGLTCFAEYIAPVSPVVETEYCAFAFLEDSFAYLNAVTGNPEYCDHIERIVFNGAQGARKKDEKAIAYMSAPNQVFATEQSGAYADFQVYSPCHPTACCPVTSTWVVPNYVRNMILRDKKDNFFFSLYGPCHAAFGDFTIYEDTSYPFRDTIRITFSVPADTRSCMNFRIPGWCQNARFKINGAAVEGEKKPASYFPVDRVWKDGDVLEITFPMKLSLSRVDDSDGSKRYPLALEYGPLLFSLPIPEIWEKITGHPHTPLPDGWSWYSVNPSYPSKDCDNFEIMGYKKYLITWNVALDENLDTDKIQIVFDDNSGYVWENPPVKLRIPAYKALYSYPPYAHTTPEVYDAPIAVQEKLEIELVPFGCTALRITYFPRADV